MKTKRPYYIVSAVCKNKTCKTTGFRKKRFRVEKTGTSGQSYRIEHLVCPECRMWAKITDIEPVH